MAKIEGTNKHDVLKGTSGHDLILGFGGDDLLKGLAGDDVLKGGAGNDTFDGGGGADAFFGGSGVDTVSYADSKHKVGVDLENGIAEYGATGDTFSGIENLDGSSHNDFLFGDAGDNRLRGGAGHDLLKGGDGNDTLYGGNGWDLLYGGKGADAFYGGRGYDGVSYTDENNGVTFDLQTGVAKGAAKGDTFHSIEYFYGTDFADVMKGDAHQNSFWGNGDDDQLFGRGGNDQLGGGEGADLLNGGGGDDRLYPGDDHDADVVIGGSGKDWVDYCYTTDVNGVQVYLGTGTANFGAVNDTFSGVENVMGSRYNDSISPAKNGWADGGEGDDIVIDYTGTEVLRGGPGIDTLTDNFLGIAEDGKQDIFVLEPDNGLDTIIGFDQGQDLFWLPANMFTELLFNNQGELAAGRVVNDTSPTATKSHAQLIYDTDDHILWYDSDGTGPHAPVQVAEMSNFYGTLARSDFVVMVDI